MDHQLHTPPKSYMDHELYNAAIFGNIDVLEQNEDNIAVQITPANNTVLHLASQFGKKEGVSHILSMHPLMLCRINSSGDSALHIAARNGHYDVVLTLISHAKFWCDASGLESGVGLVKEMLRMRNGDGIGDTALHDAVRYHHLDVVKLLLKEDCDFPYAANFTGETPLYIAARRGYVDLVAVILEICTSPPPYGGPDGSTALHGAVISGSLDSAEKLVNWNKSLVTKTDVHGRTPLHCCALLGNVFMGIPLLLADKSSLYLVDNEKNIALHVAISSGNNSLAKMIILFCQECCEVVNGRKQNILHIALENKNEIMVDFMLRRCGEITSNFMTQKDEEGNTPFHLMAASNLKVPQLMKHAMADRAALNKQNFTPLDMVSENNRHLWDALKEGGYRPGEKKMMDLLKSRRQDTVTSREENQAVKEKVKLNEIRKTMECNIIVAALIVTVTFAAGFTMPGGYNQSGTKNPVPGMVILSEKPAFQAFMISDAIALLLACVAIFLNFWGAFLDDQRIVRKFSIATTFLVTAAIGAMMVAFSTATYVVLAQSLTLSIATCIVGVISIPVSVLLCTTFVSQAKRVDSVIDLLAEWVYTESDIELAERLYIDSHRSILSDKLSTFLTKKINESN